MKPSSAKNAATPHGGGIRGADQPCRSPRYAGRFGRMFRSLAPAAHRRDALLALGAAMTATPEASADTPPRPIAALETDAHLQDDEENSGIPAGYTYLGQFIDHDITFDPMSLLMQMNDPDSVVNFRTPRLDLDSLYGRGPADQPYLYLGDKFRLGKPLFALREPTPSRDLPRYHDPDSPDTAARALTGDKRDDENVIIAQLTAVFLQLHNRFVVNDPANLAARNLLRGAALQLPSGQAVARAMELAVVADADLRIGKATLDDWDTSVAITEIDASFADNAPLWFYVLAEAQYEWSRRATAQGGRGDAEPARLGALGARLVAETLIGLIYADQFSFLAQDPNWVPLVGGMGLHMGQLVKYALTGTRSDLK